MRSSFDILDTSLQGLKIIQRRPHSDHRGYLERLFCSEEFESLICGRAIVQINHSLTVRKGTVRGMHFQYPPDAETKIVSCLRGQVFDVAVDVRRNSPTFLSWHAEVLSSHNHKTIFIPEGFAHGFQSLSDDCELLYFHTSAWRPGREGGLNPRDPRVGIRWPETITELSERDEAHPAVTSDFLGVALQ